MNIAVFCGSSLGTNRIFQETAHNLGKHLANRKIGLIYGGGKVGLMGVIADAVLEAGGKVTGVIPQALKEKEIAHDKVSDLLVVPDMHTRKAKMAELADAFIAMPGGAGTLEEFFEAWTWAQLGYHAKPCALYNVNGYFNTLISFIDQMMGSGFLKENFRQMIQIQEDPALLIDAVINYQAPPPKWD